MLRLYLLNLAVAVDQLASALTGGAADETISSRLAKAQRGDYGPRWRATTAPLRWRATTAPLRWLVDALFRALTGQPDHCRTHIEDDEGWDKLAI
ncbi:hypothetical protein [Azospirillum canadense]|uniref:hypothetical protein n=1 Tax=Azospirillum canadense TaxID=403962 RepID=UPI002227E14C|nr:hypothetical protein [Azospirillum canadense]MCW2243565.1 hypothetical protein [Azospirillum canadense]